jgi:hypothetical protein
MRGPVIAVGRSQDPSALVVSACTAFVLKCWTRRRTHARTRPTWDIFSVRRSNGVRFRHPTQQRFGLDGRAVVAEPLDEAAHQGRPGRCGRSNSAVQAVVNWRHAGEKSVTRCRRGREVGVYCPDASSTVSGQSLATWALRSSPSPATRRATGQQSGASRCLIERRWSPGSRVRRSAA